MAITPEEAMRITREEMDIVATLECVIDKQMKNQFTSDTKSIVYEMSRAPMPRVVQKIKEIYQSAGWNVEYTCAGKDSRLQFTPVMKRETPLAGSRERDEPDLGYVSH